MEFSRMVAAAEPGRKSHSSKSCLYLISSLALMKRVQPRQTQQKVYLVHQLHYCQERQKNQKKKRKPHRMSPPPIRNLNQSSKVKVQKRKLRASLHLVLEHLLLQQRLAKSLQKKSQRLVSAIKSQLLLQLFRLVLHL